MRHQYLLLGIALVWCASLCRAQSGAFWQSTHGPEDTTWASPTVYGLGITADGRLDVGGSDQVFALPPGGKAWIHGIAIGDSLTVTPPPNFLAHFAYLNGSVYAASLNGGALLVSRDSGAHWAYAGRALNDSGDVYVNALGAFDGTLYAATEDGLYSTTDEGHHWTTLLGGRRPSPNGWAVKSFTVTAQHTIIAGLSPNTVRSTNDGRSWDTLAQLNTLFLRSLASHGRTVFGGTFANGLLRSDNDGRTWRPAGFDTLGIAFIECYDSVNALVVSTGWNQHQPRVYRTRDAAQTWLLAEQGIVHGSRDSVAPVIFYAAGNQRGGVLIATDTGLFVTADSGTTWAPVQPRLLSPSIYRANILALAAGAKGVVWAASAYSGVYSTDDNGASWQVRDGDLPTRALGAIVITDGGVVFVATDSGVYRSTDGAHWTRAHNGLFSAEIAAMASDVIGDVFAATSHGVFRTTDNGESWERTMTGMPLDTALAIAVAPSGDLFAGTYDGVYRSTDRGDHWTPANGGIEGEWVRSLAFDAGGKMYAGLEFNGVVSSFDNGASWRDVGAHLSGITVLALAVDVRGQIYAATTAGISRFSAGASEWLYLPFSGEQGMVPTVAINSFGYVFAGATDGVWRSVRTSVGVGDQSPAVPAFDVTIYPNPVKDMMRVRCGDATEISLVDMVGRTVKTVHGDDPIDLAEMPAGMLHVVARRGTAVAQRAVMHVH